MGKFGDFEEIKDETAKPLDEQEEFTSRARMPRKGQLAGIVIQRLGGNRMSVQSTDKKIRNCRVPGRFSRKFWLRPGDAVIIEPWPDDDNKGDVVYQYRKNEAYQLRKQGILKDIDTKF
ncbi:MAG: translation initiation factor eIF-1A [Nanoarchaeota archaeon]